MVPVKHEIRPTSIEHMTALRQAGWREAGVFCCLHVHMLSTYHDSILSSAAQPRALTSDDIHMMCVDHALANSQRNHKRGVSCSGSPCRSTIHCRVHSLSHRIPISIDPNPLILRLMDPSLSRFRACCLIGFGSVADQSGTPT